MKTPVADASVYSDFNGLAALKKDARANDPNAVREVAKQFESIFAKMVLSSMRQASFGDPLMGGQQQEFYQGMFDDQLAVELTKGRGLGLADMLVRQLTQAGLVPKETTENGAGGAKSAPPAPLGNANTLGTRTSLGPPSSLGTASPEDFVRELWPCAEAAGKELGVDPRHLLAQAALETGWGKSLPCDATGKPTFNLFGIKAGESWNGPSVSVKTLEFEGGVPIPKREKFRAYDSAQESFRDYVALLRDNPRYADALNTGSDTNAFATALQRGGYATDPAYAQKITAIAQNLPISTAALKSSSEPPTTHPLATL